MIEGCHNKRGNVHDCVGRYACKCSLAIGMHNTHKGFFFAENMSRIIPVVMPMHDHRTSFSLVPRLSLLVCIIITPDFDVGQGSYYCERGRGEPIGTRLRLVEDNLN